MQFPVVGQVQIPVMLNGARKSMPKMTTAASFVREKEIHSEKQRSNYLHRVGVSVGIDGAGHRRLFSSLPGWHTGLGYSESSHARLFPRDLASARRNAEWREFGASGRDPLSPSSPWLPIGRSAAMAPRRSPLRPTSYLTDLRFRLR